LTRIVVDKFEGRIRRVFTNGSKWFCEIYGTKDKFYNGLSDIREDVIQEAKELSTVPQPLVEFTVRNGKIVKIEA
jgi:hypothetical protein